MGYYDAQGRWISTGAAPSPTRAPDSVRQAPSRWSGAPTDVRSRENWLEQRIRLGASDGSLRRYDANRALRTLSVIRRQDTAFRRQRGWLSPGNEATIQARLDSLSDSLRWARRDGGPSR
jgi:hypothetical protein